MSRRVVVTSVVRYAVPTEMSGWFRVVDLDERRATFETVVPESVWRGHDPNPRGGTRGVRGVSVHEDRLVMAIADRLFVFDSSWQLVDEITHGLMADVHGILAEEQGIWAASTGCDALLLMGWNGELARYWALRELPDLMRELGGPGRWMKPIDPSIDYRDPRIRMGVFDAFHLNGISRGSDGLLLSFGRVVVRRVELGRFGSSVIARLTGDGMSVVHRRHGVTVPNHDVGEDEELLLYNDSNRHTLVVLDREALAELKTIAIPGDPPYVRGLFRVEPGLWLVGGQKPLAVYAVDIRRGTIVGRYPLGGIEHEAVYGISLLPGHFAEPNPRGADPAKFWRRAALGPGVTPIPT